MARRSGDLRSAFTFGGRLLPVIGFLLAVMLVGTVASWLLRQAGWAVLSADRILHGEVWRLVSWAFVQDQPLTLLFGGFMLYSFGSQLAHDWGEARFLRTFLGLTLGAGLITLVLALFVPYVDQGHLGMWPVLDGLLLMWALRYPDQQMSFWGIIPMTGRTLALLIVGGTVLFGLAQGGVGGLFAFTPHFAALLIAWALSRGRLGLSFRRWRLAWRDHRLERQLRRRSKHLKVVRKNGQGEPPQWLN